jgi:hypothetical protein
MFTSLLRRSLPAARVFTLSVVATGALLGTRSLHGAQANTPVSVSYAVSGPAAAVVGQTVTYTLNVKNENSQAATDLYLSLFGASTATLDSFTAGSGISCAEHVDAVRSGVSCSPTTLAAGATTTVTIQVTLGDAAAPTYSVRGYAGPQLCRCLIPTFETDVAPTPALTSAPTTSQPQPYVPAPNYNGQAWDPNAGPYGPA